ncbi:MAG: helix-turn-helix transcriptional regulator [Myxococcales bacterium]|nr:helix-turn-helix transcriptional regulator [Myxococcales bacterium]
MNAARHADLAPPSSPLPRRRDEARALFRNAILDAAEVIFAARSFHGARIQDIAARARIAVGTVYNHFAQKDDVLDALLDDRSEALLAQLRATSEDPERFEDRLRLRVARLLAYSERHRAFFAVANEHGLFASPGGAGPGEVPRRAHCHRERFRAALPGARRGRDGLGRSRAHARRGPREVPGRDHPLVSLLAAPHAGDGRDGAGERHRRPLPARRQGARSRPSCAAVTGAGPVGAEPSGVGRRRRAADIGPRRPAAATDAARSLSRVLSVASR